MPLYYVRLMTPMEAELNAETEQAAINMLKESIRNDSMSSAEVRVEEIGVEDIMEREV